jgi:hypothetical protein
LFAYPVKRRLPSALEWLFADAEPPPECPGDAPDERLIMADGRPRPSAECDPQEPIEYA